MTRETVAYAAADPRGDLMVETVRSTEAKARAAAVNALHWPGRWPSMVAAGYSMRRVAVRFLPDDSPDSGETR